MQLVVGVFGGLGAMASPMAVHWKRDDSIRVACVHDRNAPGVERDHRRTLWKECGARLVSSVSDVLEPSELDGVFVCCGKNGDALELIAQIAVALSKKVKRQFLCHMSTVTAGFVHAATAFCSTLGVDYVNYPLTGGPSGAEKGTMLILTSGSVEVYHRLAPVLSKIGVPRYFGEGQTAAAEVKLMGQAMVFNGLLGLCSAVALHTECFQGGVIGGSDQGDFFDFLNAGAGGTRQWEVAVSSGVRRDSWNSGFLVSYAAIDAIYAAKLCLERGLSAVVVRSLVQVALTFSFVLNTRGASVATHAIVQELVAHRARELDSFIDRHCGMEVTSSSVSLEGAIQSCIESLPPSLQPRVALTVSESDFSAREMR